MSNIIPFGQAGLPAYVKNRRGLASDLTTGVGPGFPKLSIKGKSWAVVRGQERTILMNPKDPESVASYIGVVIIKASAALSRAFYKGKFDDSATENKPVCASVDGVKPDAGVAEPQSTSCAACAHAVYRTGEGGKGFRCGNHRRVVVAKPGAFGDEDLMLLQVPGGSLKNLAAFARKVDSHGLDYNMCLTKLSFDPAEATPRIVFEPAGVLPEDMYEQVAAVAEGEQVRQILGSGVAETANGDVAPTPAPAVVREMSAEPEPVKKVAAKKVEVAEDELASVLGDAVETAEVTPEPVATKPATTSAIGDELDDMLSEFDD